MSLAFYDESKVVFASDPLRTFHDGRLGGPQEKLIYIRNRDATKYYTNLILSLELEAIDDGGPFGSSGWGIKLIAGERRPTEAEWDQVRSGDVLSLADIGSTSVGNTSTYLPVWVRVYCPGNTKAQIRTNMRLVLRYYERMVGA